MTVSYLTMVTGLVWPILWTLSMAWSSVAWFHHKSIMKALLDAVKFSPTPPALRLIRRQTGR